MVFVQSFVKTYSMDLISFIPIQKIIQTVLNKTWLVFKYRNIPGLYEHSNGTVEMKYKGGKSFHVTGTDTGGRIWVGSFTIEGEIGVGKYEWKDKVDCGKHEYIICKDYINVTWYNTSSGKKNEGAFILTRKATP
jgi:hypothetical protein